MTSRNRLIAGVTLPICAAILLAGTRFASAGDLNPPAGPVAPTHKTLTEVEPRVAINATNTSGDADSLFKIIAPGSYYLTGNITGVSGKHGIEIVVSGVTIDLNGFDLLGVGGGDFDGVSVTLFGVTNITVVNGSVRNWGGEGVYLDDAITCRVEGVLASGNAGFGIFIGKGSTVTNCSAPNNVQSGILVNNGSTVTNCSASNNADNGITVSSGCTVSNCSADSNTHSGIVANLSCTVRNCSARSNSTNGIIAGTGCMVAECTAQSNTLDGIRCDSQCVIRGNTCSSNGSGAGDGAGIHATGVDNRIEGNNCTAADRGIDVDLAGNFITRNTCSGNLPNNWDIVAGNVCLVVQGVAGAAILGNTGGVAPGSIDPNANFTY